jgi:hypothetical protein
LISNRQARRVVTNKLKRNRKSLEIASACWWDGHQNFGAQSAPDMPPRRRAA